MQGIGKEVPVLVVVAAMSMVVVVMLPVVESTFRLSSRDWNVAFNKIALHGGHRVIILTWSNR